MPDLSVVRMFPDTCTEEVTRRGVLEPCEKPAVAARIDVDGGAYAVCSRHARGPMVPLRALLGAVLGSGGGTE